MDTGKNGELPRIDVIDCSAVYNLCKKKDNSHKKSTIYFV